MPIDINRLRAEKGGDPAYWRDVMRKRFKPVELIDSVVALDQEWRKAQFDLEQTRKELGGLQKKVAEAKKAGDAAAADALIASMAAAKEAIPAREEAVEALKRALEKEVNKVPNDVDPSSPISRDEADNVIVTQWGECATREGLLHHHELLWMIEGYEPERGVGVAGHRAYFLTGMGLLLNQALINFGLSYLSGKSYKPVMPPFFMNKEAMAQVAQLEDFDEQLYKVTGEGSDDTKYLIATSEQPICAYHRGEWLAEKELPKRYAGYSACFRKEAGSHGRDTWGIFRVHQFDKVEQFVVCEPEESPKHFREMVEASEGFYKALGIPYRVVNICSGELNNAATVKNDLEGWFPSLANYRELVSCSNCTDYQSRAMEVRCGATKVKAVPGGDSAKKYVHFLNGTLCATTRTICAILENYQTADGVKVPDVLVPFMGGTTFIPFTRKKPVNVQEAQAAKKGAAAAGGGGEAGGAGASAVVEAAAAPVGAAKKVPVVVVAAAPVRVAPAVAAVVPIIPAAIVPGAAAAVGVDDALEATLTRTPFVSGWAPGASDLKALSALEPGGTRGVATARWVRQVLSYSVAEREKWV